MEQGFIKVAAVSPKIKVADPVYNGQAVCECLQQAYEQQAKIIVFPELCLTGYTCGDLFLQGKLLSEAARALEKVAAATAGHDALVFVGLPLEREGRLYNVAAALQDGAILGLVPKANIPAYAEFYEGRHFTEGNSEAEPMNFLGKEVLFGTNQLFACRNIPELVVGCEICEDLWVANPPATNHALMGATVIVNLSASNEVVGKDEYRQLLVESASARLLCGYIYASAGEGESTQDVVFGGHNMIAENGTVLEQSKRFMGESIYSEIDVLRLVAERRRMGSFGKKPQLRYVKHDFSLLTETTSLSRRFGAAPFVPVDEEKRSKRCEEILSIQSYGLKKRLEHTGVKTAVLGISGGLDSTLAPRRRWRRCSCRPPRRCPAARRGSSAPSGWR